MRTTNGNGHVTSQVVKLLKRIRHQPEISLEELRRVIETPEAITVVEEREYCDVIHLGDGRYRFHLTAKGWGFLATYVDKVDTESFGG